ncbi:MAG: recombinase family protein [Acidimicrobiales bacterium]
MWRVAVYARETPGHAGRSRLERQIGGLAAQVARQPGWHHVATYVDQAPGGAGPGFARLLADAPGHFDLVVVDGYGRLSANRHELVANLARLRWAGVDVVVLRPSRGRRLAKLVANLALADLLGEAAR